MKSYVGRPLSRFFISIEVLFLVLIGTLLLTGCLDQGSGSEDDTQVVAEPGEVTPPLDPLTPPERTVCDPFNSGASAQDRGLVGHLLYLKDDQPRYREVQEYIDNGHPVQSTIYFDKIHVPTRAFDLGFYTQDGTLVTNHNDEPIYEYFALRLESQLMLAANENPGWYQMAVLSDDGAVLDLKDSNNNIETLIDNDGFTPTRMGCATRSIYLDKNTKQDMILSYFQGPRYHIAMMMMWRPLPEGVDPNDPVGDVECGQRGNSRYFDSTQVPSEPQMKYYELLARGWKPLTNENFYFPEQALNPCAAEDPLLLVNFSIDSVTRTDVTVSWSTSIPSTSQIEVKNVVTGAVMSSALDSTLKLNHSVSFTGLSSNTLYSVKAISETSGGQRAESAESAFRTPR